MQRKNLIMGMWTTLPFERLEIFLASLHATGFDGDVCIFVEDVSPDLVAKLREQRVIVERASPYYIDKLGYQVSRFFNYLGFLSRHAHEYELVLVTDLRDVFFQADPFKLNFPADVIFAQERQLLGACRATGGWVRAMYGEEMVHHLRDFLISCSGTTFGTVPGMLDYLAAMTSEFCRLGRQLLSGWDQGVHNYIVRMRPPFNSWFDTSDSLVATLHYMPDKSLEVTSAGVLVDGRSVPVIHQWDRRGPVSHYVGNNPRFRFQPDSQASSASSVMLDWSLAPALAMNEPMPADAIICYYHGPDDAGALSLFLSSARATGFAGALHCCAPTFDDPARGVLEKYGCEAHLATNIPTDADADNVAHMAISQVLDKLLSRGEVREVLAMDSVRAGFLRNPFLVRTHGLSLFLESAVRLGESDVNTRWLAAFGCAEGELADLPIISSSLVRGAGHDVSQFYHRLLAEVLPRSELLGVHKVIQGAFNRLAHSGSLGIPVTLHANGSQAYFEIWSSDLPVVTKPVITVGGVTPALIVSPRAESSLLDALRTMMQI